MPSEDKDVNIADLASRVAALTVFVYLLGFVTTNAHLAKWDVYTFELLNVQYLAAGLVTVVAFTIFGFSVGRRVHYMTQDFNNLAGLGNHYRWPKLWTIFCQIFVIVEIVFAGVVATLWTAMIFFRETQSIKWLVGAVSLAFVVDYLLVFGPGVYKRKPYIALPLSFVFFLIAIVAAWPATHVVRILALFFLYAVAGFVLAFILQVQSGSRIFHWFWTSITILVAASAFGSLVYGEVRRNLGGGEASRVKLVMMKDVPQTVKNILGVKVDESQPMALIGETTSELILSSWPISTDARPALRIKRELIAGIISGKDDAKADVRVGCDSMNSPTRPPSVPSSDTSK